MLDGVEVDIDTWPYIPSYVEFESDSEEKIRNVCKKLNINFDTLTTLDVTSIYKHYGYESESMKDLILEENRRIFLKK